MMEAIIFHGRNRVAGQSILPKWQTKKPYISIGETERLPWCTVVSDHDDLSTGGVTDDPD